MGVGGMAGPFGHLAHDLLAHHAVTGDGVGRDVQQQGFGLVPVGDRAAFEIGRGAGYGRKARGDVASRAAFGHGERQHAVHQQFVYAFLGFRTAAGGCQCEYGEQREDFIHGRSVIFR